MPEHKEDFNYTLLKAARGNRANAIGKALFESTEKQNQEQKQ